MSDLDTHADAVIAFNKRLRDGGVTDDVAGVCTVDLNKILLSRNPPPIPSDPEAQRAEIREAAARKAEERAARLAGQS